MSVHTTADDPTKYRSEEEVQAWARKDPLTRFRAYLEGKGLLDESVESAVDAEISEAVRRFEAVPAADPLLAFDHAYAERPASLEAQRAELIARLGDGGAPPAAPAPAPEDAVPMRGQRQTRR